MKTVRAIPFLLVFCLAFPAANLFGQAKAPAKKSATGKGTPSKASVGTDPALLNPALARAKAPESFKVKFTTTQGDFTVQVTRAWSPLGADRFYNLAKHHFFDGCAFFRVLKGFVAQFGLNPNPKVTQAWESATIQDEPVKQGNRRGFLTYAKGGPNTRSTQFFINLADNPRLDPMGFPAFGEVIEGMDVVDKFYAAYGEGAPDGKGPNQGLIMQKGKAYLDAGFPKLDKILSTAVEAPPPAAAPAKGPAKSGAKAPPKSPAKSPAPKQP
jgi:peptidyl-prolyl cis-trans isomerase A (cyclophilin A)